MEKNYDESNKDRKYFIDGKIYNCPFCNRRNVIYKVVGKFKSNWSKEREVYGYLVKCTSCSNTSLHLSDFSWNTNYSHPFNSAPYNIEEEDQDSYDDDELDDYFFYHQPTSFFVIDVRIPKVIREHIAEAEGCKKMGYMTGASGALRKAIYKFLKSQKLSGNSYEEQIKNLKTAYPRIPGEYIDALSNIQNMTSTKLHEDLDFEPWNQKEFDYIIQALKDLLDEVYVKPDERKLKLRKLQEINPFNRVKDMPKKE